MPPKRTTPFKNSPHPFSWASQHHSATPTWWTGLFLLTVLPILLPSNGHSEAITQPEKAYTQQDRSKAGGVVRREGGFPIPRKGPLISELREDLDPEISGAETVIRRYEDAIGNEMREFYINGALFQIEVTPVNGPPYYLIDVNGNGLFQERYQGHQSRLVVPQWVLFRF